MKYVYALCMMLFPLLSIQAKKPEYKSEMNQAEKSLCAVLDDSTRNALLKDENGLYYQDEIQRRKIIGFIEDFYGYYTKKDIKHLGYVFGDGKIIVGDI